MFSKEAVAYFHFDTQNGIEPRWVASLMAKRRGTSRFIEAYFITLDKDTPFANAAEFSTWRAQKDIGVHDRSEQLCEALQHIIADMQRRGWLFHVIAANSVPPTLWQKILFKRRTGLKNLRVHNFDELLEADCRAAGEFPAEANHNEKIRALAKFAVSTAKSMPAGRFELPKGNTPLEFIFERDADLQDAYWYRLHYIIKRHKLDDLTQAERELRATIDVISQEAKNRYPQEPTYADSFRQRIDAEGPEASSGISEEFFLAITRTGRNAGFGFSCRVCGLTIPAECPVSVQHCGKTSVVDPTAQMRKVQIGSTARAGMPGAFPLRDDDNETVEYEQADPGGI